MILLDTHVLVWMASEPKQLSMRAREAIREARERTGVAIATITLWELAWLAENGRIQISASVESFVRETVARVILKPMTPEIAALAVRLRAAFPKDPADRLRSEEHTSELQSRLHLVCRLLLEKKKKNPVGTNSPRNITITPHGSQSHTSPLT